MKPVGENKPSLEDAKAAESAGKSEEAAKIYEEIFRLEPRQKIAANRLMIIYRKLKQYKKELRTINKGIKNFEAFYKSKSRHKKNKTIAELSIALSRKTGLTDRKGNAMYDPEPIATWKKRKVIVEKKIAG